MFQIMCLRDVINTNIFWVTPNKKFIFSLWSLHVTNSNILLLAMRRQMLKPMQCNLPLKTDVVHTATPHAFPTFTFQIPASRLLCSPSKTHLYLAGCPPSLSVPRCALIHDLKLQSWKIPCSPTQSVTCYN